MSLCTGSEVDAAHPCFLLALFKSIDVGLSVRLFPFGALLSILMLNMCSRIRSPPRIL